MATTASTSTLLEPIWRLLGWLSLLLLFFFTANVFAAQATLAWNASNPNTGVDGYHVVYGQASKSYTTHLDAGKTSGTPNTQLLITGLEEGKTYYFAVHAHDASDSVSSANSTELPYPVPYAAPVANFNATVSGLTATFTDTSTGNVTERTWNFGDNTGDNKNPTSHPYAVAGTYNVTLTAKGPGGSTTATKAVTVQVVPAPVATLTLNKKTGPDPLTVIFTVNCTGSNISSCNLDYGDGTSFSVPRTSTQSVSHNYAYRSTPYAVKLTVSGSGGSIVISEAITVIAAQPSAIFSATTTATPLAVKLANASTGTVKTWSWTFGDGGVSSVQNPPDYTYRAAGTYEISLTARGPTGLESTTQQSITVSAAKVDSGLVAAYNFEEASGATVVDASGKGNHGTIKEAARTTSGKFGSALSFDGVNDWVTVNDSPSLDLSNGMTLEAWVYPTATMSSWRSVLLKEQTGGLAYALYANSDSNQAVASLNIGGDKNLAGGSALGANAWVHLAATYDGTTQRLYVNGNQVASKAQTGNMQATSGALRIGGNSAWSEFFKGRIDEIRIYNRALSATEIKTTDMNTAVTKSSPPKPLLGNQSVGTAADTTLSQGMATAFKTTASVTGQVTSLPVHVYKDSTATVLVAGIYSDNNGQPGALLAQGTLQSLKAADWNRVILPAVAVTATKNYWIAILGPTTSSGKLSLDKVSGSVTRATSKDTKLTSLPQTWTTGSISTNGSPLPANGAGY